jgi:hypothetical protein
LTVPVIERPPFGQEFRDFWTTYGQVISLFEPGFAEGFSTHIMKEIKERRDEKKKRRESTINKEQVNSIVTIYSIKHSGSVELIRLELRFLNPVET